MDFSSASITSRSPAQTKQLAEMFAPFCKAGLTLLLDGPIGAGKSLFARALITHLLDVPEDIPSPTFTLVQVYETRKFDIWHSDLYRVNNPDDVFELGLDEAFETALCIVEWPDRLGAFTPDGALSVSLKPTENENHRALRVSSENAHWHPLIKALKHGL